MNVGRYNLDNLASIEPVLANRVATHYRSNSRTASMWDKFPNEILRTGDDAKTKKGQAFGFLTGIAYLLPADSSGEKTFCSHAILAGCKNACLVSAGHGQRQTVLFARLRKSLLYRQYPTKFKDIVDRDIYKLSRRAKRLGLKPAVRLNGTSDIDHSEIITKHPEVQHYDYSKVAKRITRNTIENYHLTGSYSNAKERYSESIFNLNRNGETIAVVFRTPQLAKSIIAAGKWRDLPGKVVPGDLHDLTFLWPTGSIIALYAKGKGKNDYTGFIQDN